MSALEKISTALQASTFTPEQAPELARELYGLVAHELAEKIRSTDDGRCNGGDCCGLYADDFADLIDPEVSP